MIFDVVNMKDSNAKIFMKYYIDDTTMISNNFTKFSFEFENFFKKENAAQTREKEQKKEKNSKENENENFEKTKEKKTDE